MLHQDYKFESRALYPELKGVNFSALKDFSLSDLIGGTNVDVSLSKKFKELFDYEAILAGPFSGVKDEKGNEKGAMEVFKERVADYGKRAIDPILSVYD
ncbi:MAG: hypothetical protein IKN20_02730, partial [Firmicutes bacterium]|nr:hypothetical protein [Bacillota bacterium]